MNLLAILFCESFALSKTIYITYSRSFNEDLPHHLSRQRFMVQKSGLLLDVYHPGRRSGVAHPVGDGRNSHQIDQLAPGRDTG